MKLSQTLFLNILVVLSCFKLTDVLFSLTMIAPYTLMLGSIFFLVYTFIFRYKEIIFSFLADD